MEFQPFPKLARLSRECIITEKIDGTNAQIFIDETGKNMLAGSRNRWLTADSDNFGFCRWVNEHFEELLTLGPGRHFGEWWGNGIQRGYGLSEKRFSLFNVTRWCRHDGVSQLLTVADPKRGTVEKYQDRLPQCVGLVPTLFRGQFDTDKIEDCLRGLAYSGSVAAPGFAKPEGIVIFHTASGTLFKKTVENDETPKSLVV